MHSNYWLFLGALLGEDWKGPGKGGDRHFSPAVSVVLWRTQAIHLALNSRYSLQ